MADPNPLPVIGEAERTPLVEWLLARIEQLLEEQRRQAELIQQLRDEIAVLKGEKARPKFKPSGMEQQTEPETGRPSPRPPTVTPGPVTPRAHRPSDRARRSGAKPPRSPSTRASGSPPAWRCRRDRASRVTATSSFRTCA